jgi:hypothetical protein
MARKQLIAGSNARRLEDRISRVPPDIRDEGGIFRELRMREETDDLAKADEVAQTDDVVHADIAAKEPGSIPKRSSARPRPAAKAPQKKPASGSAARLEVKPEKNNGSRSTIPFTRHERELISKCCVEYRNHLPIYLKSVRHEVNLLESIIRKCAED